MQGFVGQFLSWKGWVPFSKLTYSAYLCHYVFLLVEAGSVRTPGIISTMAIVSNLNFKCIKIDLFLTLYLPSS